MTKFYTDMYGGTKDRPEQKGIKLWSDWNSQIYEWAKEYAPTHVWLLQCVYSVIWCNQYIITCMMGGGGMGSMC